MFKRVMTCKYYTFIDRDRGQTDYVGPKDQSVVESLRHNTSKNPLFYNCRVILRIQTNINEMAYT